MSEIDKKWYVLRAIGGKEKKVKEYIESEISRLELQDYVSQVLIPTDHDLIVMEYGLFPLRNLFKKRIEDKSIMKMGGLCVMGIGESSSENKVDEAVKQALNNPLLDVEYEGAQGALIHITGGTDMTLQEASRDAELLTSKVYDDAKY